MRRGWLGGLGAPSSPEGFGVAVWSAGFSFFLAIRDIMLFFFFFLMEGGLPKWWTCLGIFSKSKL